MAGRPTDLTPELHDAFCAALRRTWYLDHAADLVGINRATVYAWMKRGRKEKKEPASIYTAFNGAVKKVLAERTADCLDIIADAAKSTWQAAAWLTERRHPEKWGSARAELADLRKAVIALEKSLASN